MISSPLAAAVPTQANIEYLGSERTEKMDAWLPPDSFKRPVPAVLLIHGGGWGVGDKADPRERNIATNLTAAGFAVFSINYRLEAKTVDAQGKTTTVIAWPQNFYDCKSALRFLKKESVRFDIDPQRIATMGGSAGGHLAMMVGMTGHNSAMNTGGLYQEQDNQVACMIDLYGVPDVRRFGKAQFTGATPQETEENFDKASPIRYLGKDTPPILVLHGTADKIVPLQLSRDLVARLNELGIPHQYMEIPDAPHTFHLQSTKVDLGPVVIGFLIKYLGDPAKK